MTKRNWKYIDFRATFSEENEKDLIDHILKSPSLAGMSGPEKVRVVTRCHMKVVKMFGSPDNLDNYEPPWVKKFFRKLDEIPAFVKDGGKVEDAIDNFKEGFTSESSFFEDDE